MPKLWSHLPDFSSCSFIIGSGPSIDSYGENFFSRLMDSGTVLGVNNVASNFPCHYNVRKSFGAERSVPSSFPKYDYANPDCQLIISEHDCGTISSDDLKNTNVDGDYFFFAHKDNLVSKGVNWPENDQIIVSWSTMTSAMHLAAAMGSTLIILIGHDLTGRNYSLYPSAPGPRYSKFRKQSKQVREYLEDRYGCTIVSMSPFLGLGRKR